jgi:hypothetical protein
METRSPDRTHIISALHRALEPLDFVLALWLEGADATGTVDEWSDIDVWLGVRDGAEASAFEAIDAALGEVGALDLNLEMQLTNAPFRQRAYHLRDTPDYLFIDVCVQPHSRDFAFVRGHDTEKPLVLFDKANVIRYRDVPSEESERDIAERLVRIDSWFAQRARITPRLRRGHFLEALAYYRRFVLDPLVELLRLQHAPHKPDFGLKHIEHDLPPDVVRQLESLHRVSSCDDIAARVSDAAALFDTERRRFEPRTS